MGDSWLKDYDDPKCEESFKRLFGDKPDNQDKAKMWDKQRLAFYLAWKSGKDSMKEEIEQYFTEHYGKDPETSIWSMCEECVDDILGETRPERILWNMEKENA